MAEYDDTNRGALFKNEDKQSESHSDYNGTINVDGTEYWINAWLKTAKSGKKFMSLSVKPKQGKAAPRKTAMQGIQDMDDSIPF